jgi:acetyltransferase-like isoleucine patch superfamily enzyme
LATLWWRGYLKIGFTFINPETPTMKKENTVTDNIFFNRADLKHCGSNVIIGKTARIRYPELVSIGDNVIIDDFTYI